MGLAVNLSGILTVDLAGTESSKREGEAREKERTMDQRTTKRSKMSKMANRKNRAAEIKRYHLLPLIDKSTMDDVLMDFETLFFHHNEQMREKGREGERADGAEC